MAAGIIKEVIAKQSKPKKKRGRPKKIKPKTPKEVVLKPVLKKQKSRRFMGKDEYEKRMSYLRRKLNNTLELEEQEKYLKMVDKLKNDVMII